MYRLMFAVTGALFAGAMLQEPAPLPAAQTQAPGHAQIPGSWLLATLPQWCRLPGWMRIPRIRSTALRESP